MASYSELTNSAKSLLAGRWKHAVWLQSSLIILWSIISALLTQLSNWTLPNIAQPFSTFLIFCIATFITFGVVSFYKHILAKKPLSFSIFFQYFIDVSTYKTILSTSLLLYLLNLSIYWLLFLFEPSFSASIGYLDPVSLDMIYHTILYGVQVIIFTALKVFIVNEIIDHEFKSIFIGFKQLASFIKRSLLSVIGLHLYLFKWLLLILILLCLTILPSLYFLFSSIFMTQPNAIIIINYIIVAIGMLFGFILFSSLAVYYFTHLILFFELKKDSKN